MEYPAEGLAAGAEGALEEFRVLMQEDVNPSRPRTPGRRCLAIWLWRDHQRVSIYAGRSPVTRESHVTNGVSSFAWLDSRRKGL